MMGLTKTEGFGLRMACPNYPRTCPASKRQMQSAYLSIISLRAMASVSNLARQLGYPQKVSSTVINQNGFSYAILPTIHPCRLFPSTICFAVATLLMPPLISKLNSGKSALSLQTRSQISGGIVRFWAGFKPLRKAFLAWMMKCLIGPLLSPETSLMNPTKNSQVSNSSTPNLHLTVHLIDTAFCIASMHSRTKGASFMRQAPKEPFCTLGLGQPTLRLISSQPYCWPRSAASASRSGSDPPSCSTMGCSYLLKGRRKPWL